MTAQSTLARLLEDVSRRRPLMIDLGLERITEVLARLGNPQDKLPPTFHVAGTNGKGSTVSFLASILEASGARVHRYTSPHLVQYNERIVLAGEQISDADLLLAIQRVDEAAGDAPLTFFETLTCAGFVAFSEVPADYLVLEVGLGGRLDATNVLKAPLATVITPVSFDHEQFLGNTLTLIAQEKAGIFKADVPAVIGVQSPEAGAALEMAALKRRAPLYRSGQEWTAWPEHGGIVYQDETGLCDLDGPRMAGAHQVQNAALAVAAVRAAGIQVTDDALSAGIRQAHWPARLQRLTTGPIVECLCPDPDEETEVWLDGGHNVSAAEAVCMALAEFEENRPKPLIMIVGMQSNKDASGFLGVFAGLAKRIVTVAADHRAARSAGELADVARAEGFDAISAATLEEATKKARQSVNGKARFLICGSLYLAGEVLAHNG
ncbi:MAG: folylpolyglutamate synthase/dihydrofolate synthase family protein [Pseudomonadota bacterium]